MEIVSSNNDALLARYLDVCHQAIACNRDRFPFKQIWNAVQEAEQGKTIEVTITGGPDLASYAMTLKGHDISVVPHDSCANCQCDRKWSVRKDYLETVIRSPEIYVRNPAKLDWEWMYDAGKA